MTTPASTIRGGLLAILATAMLAGCGSQPGVSSTASASPSTSPSPTGYAAPGEVTIDPSLPSALPLPDGIWDQTGPGWVLVDYRPSAVRPWDEPDPPIVETTRHVIYLVSPDGTRYQVAELDPNRGIYLQSWSAGETDAYIWACDEPGPDYCAGTPAVLHLDTGTFGPSPLPAEAGNKRNVTTYPGGIRVWGASDGVGPYLDKGGVFTALGDDWGLAQWQPIGSGAWLPLIFFPSEQNSTEGRSVIRLVSLATGESIFTPDLGPGWSCLSVTEVDAQHFGYYCENWTGVDGAAWGEYVFDIQTRESVQTGTGIIEDNEPTGEATESSVSHTVAVGPEVWVGIFNDGAAWSESEPHGPYPLGVDDHGVLTPVVLVDESGRAVATTTIVTAVGTTVYATATAEGAWYAQMLFSYDASTGTQRLLVPTPPAWPTLNVDPVAGGFNLAGMLSWVVAP